MVKLLAVALAVVFIVQWSYILCWVMLQRQHINLKSLISGITLEKPMNHP